MENDDIQPLFATVEPGPRWKTGEAAAIIMEPGMDLEALTQEIRGWIRGRYVHTRTARVESSIEGYEFPPQEGERVGKGTKNPHTLLSISDVGVAKILSILKRDYGITDPQIMSFASAACYGWQDGDHTAPEKRFYHPIFNAVNDTAPVNNRDWVFRLDPYRDDETGMRIFQTALYDIEAPPARRFDGAAPRGSLALNLRPHLQPIMEAALRKAKAN